MERTEIIGQLNRIFRDVLENPELLLTEQTTADDVEEWDSLTHIQLIVEIEKSLGIRFSSREIRRWNNVGEMIDSIAQKH